MDNMYLVVGTPTIPDSSALPVFYSGAERDGYVSPRISAAVAFGSLAIASLKASLLNQISDITGLVFHAEVMR